MLVGVDVKFKETSIWEYHYEIIEWRIFNFGGRVNDFCQCHHQYMFLCGYVWVVVEQQSALGRGDFFIFRRWS